MLDPLTELALRHGTDKWGWHRYTPIYDELFAGSRSTAENVLELGVLNGASLRMWRDYFTTAHIYGVDLKPPDVAFGERITTLQADLGNFRHYSPIVQRQYDVIIDDASHFPEHQIQSLSLLWPTLKPGGYYVIEDVVELTSWTRMLALLYGPLRLYDLRGPHNAIDDVLIVLRKSD